MADPWNDEEWESKVDSRRDWVFIGTAILCALTVIVLVIGSVRGARYGLSHGTDEGPTPTFVLHDHPGMDCWLEHNEQQPLKVEEICKPGTTGDGR